MESPSTTPAPNFYGYASGTFYKSLMSVLFCQSRVGIAFKDCFTDYK